MWIVCGGLGVHLMKNPVRSTREMTTGAQQHAIMKLAWRFVRSSGREPVRFSVKKNPPECSPEKTSMLRLYISYTVYIIIYIHTHIGRTEE